MNKYWYSVTKNDRKTKISTKIRIGFVETELSWDEKWNWWTIDEYPESWNNLQKLESMMNLDSDESYYLYKTEAEARNKL